MGWRRWWGRRSEAAAPVAPPVAAAPAPASLDALLAARAVQRWEIERWRVAFDRLPLPCLVANPAGRVVHANRAARETAALGGEVVLPDVEEVVGRLANPRAVRREPLADARGVELGALVVLADAEAAPEARNDGTIGEFLSHISHELKSPLNTIRSYAEMLMEGSIDDPETRKEFFNVITEESCRLAKLIENLLDLSKLDAGTLVPQRGRVRPEALLAELLRAAEAPARAKGVTLEDKLAPQLPTAYADKDLLAVAISNLVSNALKYTPEGGRVTVRARGDGEWLVVEVEDTGLGIPADEQARVFEKFYRGASAEVRKQPGTGLGLALAQQIAVLHGGRLTLESRAGKGTTFRLTLPTGAREQREAFGLPEGR